MVVVVTTDRLATREKKARNVVLLGVKPSGRGTGTDILQCGYSYEAYQTCHSPISPASTTSPTSHVSARGVKLLELFASRAASRPGCLPLPPSIPSRVWRRTSGGWSSAECDLPETPPKQAIYRLSGRLSQQTYSDPTYEAATRLSSCRQAAVSMQPIESLPDLSPYEVRPQNQAKRTESGTWVAVTESQRPVSRTGHTRSREYHRGARQAILPGSAGRIRARGSLSRYTDYEAETADQFTGRL